MSLLSKFHYRQNRNGWEQAVCPWPLKPPDSESNLKCYHSPTAMAGLECIHTWKEGQVWGVSLLLQLNWLQQKTTLHKTAYITSLISQRLSYRLYPGLLQLRLTGLQQNLMDWNMWQTELSLTATGKEKTVVQQKHFLSTVHDTACSNSLKYSSFCTLCYSVVKSNSV